MTVASSYTHFGNLHQLHVKLDMFQMASYFIIFLVLHEPLKVEDDRLSQPLSND